VVEVGVEDNGKEDRWARDTEDGAKIISAKEVWVLCD
jgi:hypothetical protein